MARAIDRERSGDADTAVRWIRDADLPRQDKQNFARFVARFPSLTFTRDDEASLDEAERADGIVLPPHFRRARRALAFVDAPLLALFDGFDYDCILADSGADIWYRIGFGAADDEMAAAIAEHAHSHVVGGWHGSHGSYLLIDTVRTDDERIFDCDGEGMADAVEEGESVEGCVEPVFASYSSMLGHIVALRTWGGEITRAVR